MMSKQLAPSGAPGGRHVAGTGAQSGVGGNGKATGRYPAKDHPSANGSSSLKARASLRADQMRARTAAKRPVSTSAQATSTQPSHTFRRAVTDPMAFPRGGSQGASALLIHSNNVCKVIKGEIHNVLNSLRADSRYVSPLRFVEEVPSDEQHPLFIQFRELHSSLSNWELANVDRQPPPKLYLPVFCSAVHSKEISAFVTGTALSSLHKFMLYGFLNVEGGADAFSVIANALLLCTFEESIEETEAVSPDPVDRQRIRPPAIPPTLPDPDDEQVVLKLLDLSSLVVRCASQSIEVALIVGLLDTCLHVSNRSKNASRLLKSAADDALAQIVLHVFCQSSMVEAREAILAKLAAMLNPRKNSDLYAVNSLTLVNIALETMKDEPSAREISILQNDLCKYLLQWTTTHDLVILSLSLRVIFNLFQTIRNHIKVPLEIFLTSVHLRILDHAHPPEEKEVALESLLEFCQEPAIMKDLYLNYDCDVQCTNLFESICVTLGKVAAPSSFSGAERKSQLETKQKGVTSGRPNQTNTIALQAAAAAAEVPLNILNTLALEGLMAIIDAIARRCNNSLKPSNDPSSNFSSRSDSLDEDFEDKITEEELQERKRKKQLWSKVAKAFNEDPSDKEWLKLGKESGLLTGTPDSVAKMLATVPGLDKDQIGNYLSLGPSESYPFEHEVRLEFVKHYDFSSKRDFASCLRLFLSKFRMPGEAQCIDRFMEAFSKELFRQQGDVSVFRNSDAVFVLAFSTIMLNTDLHNPMIKNDARMTSDQFIRNNRGINDGEDLPTSMLKELYDQIKDSEIQVQREIGEVVRNSDATRAEDFKAAWEHILAREVARPLFTSVGDGRSKTLYRAGIHEKDMFVALAKPALRSLSSAFVRSWDDATIVHSLKGLEQMAKISAYFSLDSILNEVMSFLLSQAKDYISGCVCLEYAGIDSGAPISTSGDGEDDEESMSIVDADSPVPQMLLQAGEIAVIDPKIFDISGAAAYRGLIATSMSLKMVRGLFPRLDGAWSALIEVFCVLRDARALPAGLADLDDFADSSGNVLPMSPYADESQKRLDDHYRGKRGGNDANEKKTWFKIPLFGPRGIRQSVDEQQEEATKQEIPFDPRSSDPTANAKTLLQVAERAEIERFMLLNSKVRLGIVKQSILHLLNGIDDFSGVDELTFEQHKAFALEIAARALLSNRERAPELFLIFLSKFESLFSKIKKDESILAPFLLERAVVTILRAHIHMYSTTKLRPRLKNALMLLPTLSRTSFFDFVSDRVACGLAIILRTSFPVFRPDDWKFFGDSFDAMAGYKLGRRLVFEGIASTVEFVIAPTPARETGQPGTAEEKKLSSHGCVTLQRLLFKFVYGAYDNDFSLSVPAILCLEKVYKFTQTVASAAIEGSSEEEKRAGDDKLVKDKELWHRVAAAFYSVCKSNDPDTSKSGWECYQRHVMTVDVEQIPDETWIALLNMMVNKQPDISAEVSRVNTFSILGQILVRVLPKLSHVEKNWKPLTEITKKVAALAQENLQHGRQGEVKPLFQYTLQTVTYLSNHMATKEFGGEKRYSAWASETMVRVLETANATGGVAPGKASSQNGESTGRQRATRENKK